MTKARGHEHSGIYPCVLVDPGSIRQPSGNKLLEWPAQVTWVTGTPFQHLVDYWPQAPFLVGVESKVNAWAANG